MFLTKNDIEALTGYKKPALQRRWLVENGYSFDVRADARPAVLADQVRARQATKGSERATHPNWHAFEEII
jgi:hypothetical protein